jgi:predicted nucleic acid-binding protein
MTADGAWAVLDRVCRSQQIRFASEPPRIENLWRRLTPASRSGSSFWTDAYLAAFAKATGYTLVTFDQGFASYTGIPLRILSNAL